MLIADGYSSNGSTVIDSKTINPAAATGCNPPATLYLPDGIGGVDGCTYDYMRAIELYPQSEKTSVFGRGVLDLGRPPGLLRGLDRPRQHALLRHAEPDRRRHGHLPGASPGRHQPGQPARRGREPRHHGAHPPAEAGLRTNELVSTAQRYVGWPARWPTGTTKSA
jgi:iron complex outermembrane receptor protein